MVEELLNYRVIDDRIATSGQPTAAQLRLLGPRGFGAVINLALPTSDHALPEEGSLVTAQGMVYVHIPVEFSAPRAEDFRKFCAVMEALQDRPVFVHCAANLRVSAFLYLYRVLHRRVPPEVARKDLEAIWTPDSTWARFMASQLGSP